MAAIQHQLHKLFKPVEDKTYRQNKGMIYIEYAPSHQLKPYIYGYWTESWVRDKSRKQLFEYRAIPAGCVDIVFVKDPFSDDYYNAIGGVFKKPRHLFGKRSDEVFGIRLFPWTNPLVMKDSVKYYTNKYVDIRECNKEFFKATEFIMNHPIKERIRIVEEALMKEIFGADSINNNYMNALFEILSSRGMMSMINLSQKVCMSNRQLQRIFAEHTGLSPKAFSDIIRFQHIVREIQITKEPDWLDIAAKYQFVDQSHFIKHTKKLYGMAPTQILRR